MDIDVDASTVLGEIRQNTDIEEIVSLTYQLEDFSERKLWHQLILNLEEFYSIAPKPLRVQIFNQFVSKYTKKLNTIKLTDLLLQTFGDEDSKCLESLLDLKERVNQDDSESSIYINLQIARYYIKLKNLTESNKILDELESKFNSINNDFSAKINSAYYLTKCELYKHLENYNSFYSNALLYLSTVESPEFPLEFAFDLAISAILGDKIYNFGELILHDILNVLKDSNDYKWLYKLVITLNSGNLPEFNETLNESFKTYPKLQTFDVFLKQKIIIMGLVELISIKSSLSKQLSFKDISEFTGVDQNDIEHLIIKCFSLNLFKGYINQIDEILTVTWLQPRILNLNQIKTLSDHLNSWDRQVKQLSEEVYTNGGSVWASV